jgi:hypothetical protein
LGQPETEHEDIGKCLVALPLEVVLRHPEYVISQLIHQLGHVLGIIKGLKEAVVGVPPVVGRGTLEACAIPV